MRDYGLYDGPWTPPRQDTATLVWSNNGYQDQKRHKPQFYATKRLSASWKVQSGFQYARTMNVNLPVEGARTVRVEPITTNRYPTVQILDVRADKSFTFGSFGTATLQFDVFNVINAGTVTTVRVTNTATAPFKRSRPSSVRVFRAGIRFAF